MTTPTFDLRITDFERAPWLPCGELAKARDLVANFVANDVVRDCIGDRVRRDAHAVVLMRDEDLRLGSAYREAYQAWKVAQA